MKPIYLLFLLTALGAALCLPSCKKCDLIDQIITDPAPPACEGVFYVMKGEAGVDLAFTLHEFAKPIPEPFATVSKAGPFGAPTMLFLTRSNFSAYDSTGNRYVIQHYYNTGAQFFSYDLGTGLPTLTSGPPIDVCPVFHGKPSKKLYSIFTENLSGNDWLYNIAEINPVTGQDGTGITGNSVTTNSPLTADYMSSVSTNGDLIYFLSRTNLIEVDLSGNSTRYIDIDPTYNPVDNYVHYFGLEYKPDEDLLLAIKNTTTQASTISTLVSIDVSGATPVVTTLFDISAAMPAGTDGFVNPEFYSSTFDPCDNTYYITSMQAGPTLKTNFIELNLSKNEMKLQTLEGYWYGLEFTL